MKRLIAILLIWICIFTNAISAVEIYTERGCDCYEQPCICYMQLGDEGTPVKAVIAALKKSGYLLDIIDATYTVEVEDAVKNLQRDYGLMETGMLDDETLTYLLWGMSSEVLDSMKPELTLEVVWVPTDGGKKFHNDKTCCDMLEPRKISRRNIENLGIDDCGLCYKSSKRTKTVTK